MDKNNKDYPKEQVISILKEWASPVLIGIVGMLLWRDVTEMRSDVKLLLVQQSADRVKIEQLETDVKMLKGYLFTQSKDLPNQPQPQEPSQDKQVAILKEDGYELVPIKEKK
jgi:hypothetical protein